MFDKSKMKVAARRVKASKNGAKKTTAHKNSKRKGFWTRVWNIVCWPFRMIVKLLQWFWNWLCKLNLVAMANLALLTAIIVLFSILIMDIIGCHRQVVFIANKQPASEEAIVTPVSSSDSKKVKQRQVVASKKNIQNNKKSAINVVPVNRAEVEIVAKQTAKRDNNFWGDVIIDSHSAGAMLQDGAQINGNLYLQNMHKYTLPCDIRINGNLFLRDVGMLRFCGDFVITDNIYVSPRSSFGPIPKTARLGGQVIL